VSSSAYIVNQQSKVPDDAWELVKTLNSKESHTLLSQTGTLMLGRRSVASSDAFLKAVPKPANMKAFIQITEYAKPPHLVHATGKDFTALWNTTMAPVWKGEQSVTAAMTDMARQANAMFQQAPK
jgi:ABC-type glycerol-3-phosphate transport system substrate-binding protein